jgi:alpha-L-rhamnosidase
MLFALLFLAPLAAQALAPTALKTEFLENPLGLNTAKPRFSWIMEDPTPDARQTAYQVQAASSPEKLAMGDADLWDSGKVASDQSHLVKYSGQPLASRQRVFWRVQSWDQANRNGGWSRPAWFETGIFTAAEWQAHWIAVPQETPVESATARAWARHTALAGDGHAKAVEFLLENFPPAPLFRREFEVSGAVRRARLHLGVRGYAVPSLNGRRVGDRRLDPAYREYDFNTHYVVLDVADFLQGGKNVIGLELGGGWHGIGEERAIGSVRKLRQRAECFIARLDVETDQGRQTIVSDDSWRTTPGPRVKSLFFAGEAYDAAREQPGWDAPGFDARTWSAAKVVAAGTEKLIPMLIPPERVRQTLKPVRKYRVSDNVWMYDFGRLFSGVTRLRARLPAGTTIIQRWDQHNQARATKLYYAAPISAPSDQDGLITNHNGVIAGAVKTASCYVYTAKGGGIEEWAPEFDYQSIRYVEVIGYPGEPPLDLLEGLVIHTDFERVGRFHCSDDRINQVVRGLVDTMLYSTHGILQDNNCAERQQGNTSMVANIADLLAFEFAAAQYHLKALDGVRLNTVNGAPPEILHTRGRSSLDRADTVAFHSAAAFLPWKAWLFYGDREILERHYPLMKAYLERFGDQAEHRVDTLQGWGDWSDAHLGEERGRPPTPYATNVPDGYLRRSRPELTGIPFPVNTPITLTEAARFFGALQITGRVAEILGYASEASAMQERAGRIKRVIIQRFYESTRHTYGSQTADADALQFGLFPAGDEAALAKSLRDDVMVRAGGHISGGWFMDAIPEALSKYGYVDETALLFQTDTYPSWGQILRRWGYNVIPARWPESRHATDTGGRRIQPEKATSARWAYDGLAGLRPSPSGPAFKHFELSPSIPSTVSACDVAYESPYGRIESAWRRAQGAITWHVIVPWNTRATVKLPGYTAITVNGQPQVESEFNLPAGQWKIVFRKRKEQS